MIAANALLWLTLTVYHESRGEPPVAQQAVAHVVMNRVRESEAEVHEVVTERKQFPWAKKYLKKKVKPWHSDPEGFQKCRNQALRAVLSKDFTGGATHFNKRGAGDRWAKKFKRTGQYGSLVFYKGKG